MELLHEKLTYSIIGAHQEVYNWLGFGFLESTYCDALEHELRLRGHSVEREVAIKVRYKDIELAPHRLDFVVDELLVLEVKATARLHPDSPRQLLSYLKATDLELGLLLHFSPSGARHFRVICTNNHKPFRASVNPRDCGQ